MKSPRFYFTLLLFFAGYSLSFASLHDSPLCRLSLRHTLNLEFSKADELINEMKRTEPTNNFRLLAENYRDFVRVNVSDDYRVYLAVKEYMTERINILEDEKDDTPYQRWVLGDLHFQQGILRLKFGEYLSGARSVKKSLDLLSENKELYPAFLYSNKYLGIMHAAISSIPPEYQWISSLLGIRGSLTQGKAELEGILSKHMDTDPFVTEARMLYLFTLMTFDNPEKANGNVHSARSALNKENPLEVFFLCSSLLKQNRNDEVVEVISNVDKSGFPYLHYMAGVSYLNRLDHKSAKEELTKFVTISHGQNYMKSGLLKLAWCDLIAGNTKTYQGYLAQIKTKGSASTDEDKLALNEAEKNKLPNIYLLKARLLFDGGYYNEAEKVLAGASKFMVSAADQIEYLYRFGRIAHKEGDREKAIGYYLNTINRDPDTKTWFPASAALQLGLIYEERNDRKKAQQYYRDCLSMDPPEYKASLHQKAKAGLHRVK